MKNNELKFKVSSGLKNIIGRDLISDKFIAIFELVKNSYDAEAKKVTISFLNLNKENSSIIISDDGIGMNYNDIITKWLFVAYSEKKKRNQNKNFRDNIKRNVAGSKGVGRFSCDRLGANLRLITKSINDNISNVIEIDWDRFEYDDSQEFINIPIDYTTEKADLIPFKSGTTLVITNLRENWDKTTLLKLKKSLMKLVCPDSENKDDPFDIVFDVPEMVEEDKKIIDSANKKDDWQRNIVNGLIVNDVFEKLNIKTTSVEVKVSEDGKSITTQLFDRGEYIFSFSEKNRNYTLLHGIQIKLFYLNKSAKISFTRLMGVTPVNYGSVFVYKNGFRIYPYGDPNEDFFGIDKRKSQGYNRYLGTREIMGRISISGDNEGFSETSSRAHGFIENDSVDMLSVFFLEKVLKVLERYVVNIISWGEPIKNDSNSVIMPLELPDRIISEFADISKKSDLISIAYNPVLLEANSRINNQDSLIASIEKLERIAKNNENEAVKDLAKSVKAKTNEVLKQNLQLEKENKEQSRRLKTIEAEKQIKDKQVFFLKGLANNTVKNLTNGMHLIYTSTEATRGYISEIKNLINSNFVNNKMTIIEYLSEIEKANQKANKTAELAINGNQNLKQTNASDILEFIKQYLQTNMIISGITYDLKDDQKQYICKYDPISVGIIIDNVASNSKKAKAGKIEISLKEDSSFVYIVFADDGLGLNENINVGDLFDYGVSVNSTKKGFGIGLNQILELSNEMGGTTKIDTEFENGFKLEVSIKK